MKNNNNQGQEGRDNNCKIVPEGANNNHRYPISPLLTSNMQSCGSCHLVRCLSHYGVTFVNQAKVSLHKLHTGLPSNLRHELYLQLPPLSFQQTDDDTADTNY